MEYTIQDLKNAVLTQNLEAVREILTVSPRVIAEPDENGVPVPLLAAQTGNLPIVKYLVEYSYASMNIYDPAHRDILHYAAQSGNAELARYLVERVGMSPASADRDLVTPFQLAHDGGHRELETYFEQAVGARYEELYHNPIRTGMFPDPSIVRVGDDYYMVNSSFIFFPCIPISHSRDLIHWEIIGHAVTNPAWSHLGDLEGGRGFWAPDISYDNGLFYITATYRLNDTGRVYRRQMVVTSKTPEGPYSEPVFIEEDGIDPSLFHENGRHYMLLNRGARIFEISADGSRMLSEPVLLRYGDQKRAPEGPHLLRKDGWYYLFLAEGGTGMGHRVSVMRSHELMGVYESCPYNPILRQTDEAAPIQRAGHGKPVSTPDGDWYMVYLCGRMLDGKYSMLGRETALDPITWTPDGWPIVNGLQGPSALQRKPPIALQGAADSAAAKAVPTEWSDDFSAPTLSKEWMFPREPDPDCVRFRDGLWLKGSRKPLADVGSRNILLRRQCHFAFRARTELEIPALAPGQESGLVCYYDENTWVTCGVRGTDTGLTAFVREHIGDDDREHPLTPSAPLLPGAMVPISVDTRDLTRTFTLADASVTLDNVYYLSDEGLSRGKRFTGAMVGLYAYAGESELYAHFQSFCYEWDFTFILGFFR